MKNAKMDMKTRPPSRRNCEYCANQTGHDLKCKYCADGLNYEPRNSGAYILYAVSIIAILLILLAISFKCTAQEMKVYHDGDFFAQHTAYDPDGDRLSYQIIRGNSGNTFRFGVYDPSGAVNQKDYTGKLYIQNAAGLCRYKRFDLIVRQTDPCGLYVDSHIRIDSRGYCTALNKPPVLKSNEIIVKMYVKEGYPLYLIRERCTGKQYYLYKSKKYHVQAY